MLNMHRPNARLDQLDLKTLRLLAALLDIVSITRASEMLELSSLPQAAPSLASGRRSVIR